MSAYLTHLAFEFRSGLRNPTLLLMNYLFPLGFYAMMGLIMTQINPGFTEVMVPALIIVGLMASTILGLPGPLVESREAGVFRTFKVSGVPAFAILAVPVVTTVFHGLIVAAIIVITGPIFGGIGPADWGGLIAVTLSIAFVFGAIGALIGVVAQDTRATVLLAQLIFLPAMLLSGLMMPLEFVPESIRQFTALLPPTHAMQAFQGLAYAQETIFDPAVSLLVLLTSGALAFGLAIYLFNWDNKNRIRRGHPLMAVIAWIPYIAALWLA
jgi:ABC-2 type transport system permease protein